MHKTWIGCSPSNFRLGRGGFVPEAIVIHRTADSLEAIGARCKQPNQYRSAHYAVGAAGDVHQYIEEKDTAFHAGLVVSPVWSLIKEGKNPNFYTIAVELEILAQGQAPDPQNNATADLLAEIAGRWSFDPDADHVVLHSEIRAGTGCPETGFDRNGLVNLVAARKKASSSDGASLGQVTLLRTANVRQAANSTSRIVRVARAGDCEAVVDVQEQGERIYGNSSWYRTVDGNYVWSGVTDKPNPVKPSPPAIAPSQGQQPAALNGHIDCDIDILDDLLKGDTVAPVNAKSEAAAIGAIQDLLTVHGYKGVASIGSLQYQRWTSGTTTALQQFQTDNKLKITDSVDRQTLLALLDTRAADPRASEVYLALVLGISPSGLNKILSLVAQMEGAGKFAAINANTDRAGLSFGLIQWAQKPRRLLEILVAMNTADRTLFVSIFGAGDPAMADGLIAVCRQPSGGVDPKTGVAVNPAFNLVEEPWLSRFKQCALEKKSQQTQVQVALDAFTLAYSHLRQFAPDLKSERSVAFMLDVANQCGNGGAEKVYTEAHKPGMREAELLEAIAEESVLLVSDPLKAGVRSRREHFLQTPLLSDDPFDMGVSVQQKVAAASV